MNSVNEDEIEKDKKEEEEIFRRYEKITYLKKYDKDTKNIEEEKIIYVKYFNILFLIISLGKSSNFSSGFSSFSLGISSSNTT